MVFSYLKIVRLICTIIFITLFISPKLSGNQQQLIQGADLSVMTDNALMPEAQNIVSLYAAISSELETELQWKINFKPVVLLIKDNETFQKTAGHPLVVAYAIPDRNLIVIDYSKMRRDPFSIDSIFKHELCHLLLHSRIKRENLPLWLDEGVAQWVSGGLADIIIENHRTLDSAIISGRFIPLKSIEHRFPQENRLLTLAYAESKSFVEFIVHEFGAAGILSLLKNLEEDQPLDIAFQEAFSSSFDELEKRWYDSLKKRAVWYMFFINNLYEILFSLAAILLVAAFIKAFLKKRAYRNMDEDNYE